MLVNKSELAKRKKTLKAKGGFESPESHTPWQQYFREKVQPFSEGMVLEDAPKYRGVAQKHTPRNNH